MPRMNKASQCSKRDDASATATPYSHRLKAYSDGSAQIIHSVSLYAPHNVSAYVVFISLHRLHEAGCRAFGWLPGRGFTLSKDGDFCNVEGSRKLQYASSMAPSTSITYRIPESSSSGCTLSGKKWAATDAPWWQSSKVEQIQLRFDQKCPSFDSKLLEEAS